MQRQLKGNEMKKLMIAAAAVLTVPFMALGAPPPAAQAEPDPCAGTSGAARLQCLQQWRNQMQQNQNACGVASGCTNTGGIPGLIHQGCQQAGNC
ncbi:hypothetical protein [Mycobacterium interjectum]|uniref:hypothetical protein n=1 Tax=Mycobacterium interjectum TaxID=33895 RepID=UPI00135A1523|nr:hypothetical protein [Mycobacterium interjectum]MCV7090743.1 hypothetical protein [Mycobacterium interjectum]